MKEICFKQSIHNYIYKDDDPLKNCFCIITYEDRKYTLEITPLHTGERIYKNTFKTFIEAKAQMTSFCMSL